MRRVLKGFSLFILLMLGAATMAYSFIFDKTPQVDPSRVVNSRFVDGTFHNAITPRGLGFKDAMKSMLRYYTEKSAQAIPDQPTDMLHLTAADLANAPDQSLWRLGHSTLLLKLEGKFWLTDPVFAERASPFSFIGPKRFQAPPIDLHDLPAIEAVILSHDHYDHLDKATVLAIQQKVGHFITPLGVGDRLIGWGIPATKVQQLDWWQETQVGSLRMIATPSQHFSGRSLTDRNHTLWASWVILTPHSRLFFSGDSGYFDGFKQIGDRFGPFDITMMENGAYNKNWADIHMSPEQTVQAHIDLRGKWLLPIHNGTFDLAMHAWTEPLDRVTAIASQRDVEVSTPRFGERVAVHAPTQGYAWWHQPQTDQLLSGPARTAEAGAHRS